MEEVIIIGLVYFFNIFTAHLLLEGPISLPDVFKQPVRTRLQINNQIGAGRGGVHLPEKRLIQLQLVSLQIELGKKAILLEHVIADDHFVKQVSFHQRDRWNQYL